MALHARLYGDTSAIYYLALRLLDQGVDVSVHTSEQNKLNPSLRPVRLSAQASALLKELYRRHMQPYFFLEQAPILSSWAEVGQEALTGYFDRPETLDRWIMEEDLRLDLQKLYKENGGRLENTPLQLLPQGRSGTLLEVMDLDPVMLEPNLRPAYFPHLARRPLLQTAELWLVSAAIQAEEASYEFTKIDSSLVLNETHPQGGRVLSLFSSSQYSLLRGLASLKDPRGSAPTSWKARVLGEKSPKERRDSVYWGATGFNRPGVWGIGESLGRLHPALNLNLSDALLQSERLFGKVMSQRRGESLLMSAYDWQKQELEVFQKSYRRYRFVNNLMNSERWSSFVQKTSQFLPPRVRQSLKAPI